MAARRIPRSRSGMASPRAGSKALPIRRSSSSSRRAMCKAPDMATNVAIDDNLLEEALRVGGHKSKKAAVTEALREYILRRKQARVLELRRTKPKRQLPRLPEPLVRRAEEAMGR